MFLKQIGVLRALKILLFHPRKLINLLKVTASFFLTRGTIWGVPPVLILEPSTYCQLHCPLCVTTRADFNRKNIHLSLDSVKKIASEIGNALSVILLYNQGEPFLNPHILECIEIFKTCGVFVKISTNGNYAGIDAQNIITSGLDHIIFDIDGDTQEVYERYRVAGSLQTVLTNIAALVRAKKIAQSRSPFIEVRCIVMRHNEHTLDNLKKILDTYNVDAFTIKKCQVRREDEFKNALSFIPDTFNRLNTPPPHRCMYPWVYFCILANENISPCCYDEKGAYSFGNIRSARIENILNDPAYINFRTQVKKNAPAIVMCASCDSNNDFYCTYQTYNNHKRN